MRKKISWTTLKIFALKDLMILFCLLVFYIESSSQGWVGKRPQQMPVDCIKPKINMNQANIDYLNKSSSFWYVWADRENIITSTGKRLDFLQKYLVVEQTQDKIHIVKDNGALDPDLGEFLSEPVNMGWVEKREMLLWPSALYSNITNFRIKVMTITTPDILKGSISNIHSEAQKLSFYNSPTASVPNKNQSPLFEIFYILKSDGYRFLLSKKDDLKRGEASDYVLGWVNKRQVHVWDQRQALEPKWDIEAARERQVENLPAALFGLKTEGEQYQYGRSLDKAIWKSDSYSIRKSPYWRRFPILQKENNLFETAVISDLLSASGVRISPETIARLDQLINEHRDERRNINVVFVIDGTRSMGPYMASVRRGVQNSVRLLRDSENKYKFGAVIYRDYDNPENDDCFEVFQLTANVGNFSRFIAGVDTQNPRCFNTTTSEGLYHGLHKACRSLLLGKEKETNVIILVGDAGDRKGPNRTDESKVLPLIQRYNVNILALQVHHNPDNAYEDFIYQVTDLVRKASTDIVLQQNIKYAGLQLKGLGITPRWQQNSLGNRQQYYLINSPIAGGLQYTRVGQVISVKTVESEVEKIILETNKNNNNLLKQIEYLFYRNRGDTTGSFTPEIITFLERAGLSVDQIKIMTRENYQFLMEAYTCYDVNLLKYPLFNYVLFLDQQELNDVNLTLNRLFPDQTTTINELRERLQETWLETLKANYGVKDRAQIENKTHSELLALVTGLPSPNPLLSQYTYLDIGDEDRLPNHVLMEIIQYCKQRANQLTRLTGNKEYYFKSNDRAYYWIPHYNLP